MVVVGQRFGRVQLFALLAGIAGGEIAAVVLCFLFSRTMKIKVGPKGLRCPNFWGLHRTAAWADLRSARPINFLGLRFLRAHTADAVTPLWVPLFLTEPERFAALVRYYAGVTNPLSRALEDI
jgi:hypothetical protein